MNPTEKIKVCTLKILINQSEDFHKLMIAELQNKTLLILKPKQRYHGNSMNHRILLRIMQALLLSWKSTSSNPTTLDVAKWCAKMLCSQPHHASIRIMAEWYISLHLIHEVSVNVIVIYFLHLKNNKYIFYILEKTIAI